jgi:heparosan-N-sulfate-glucuronate 5-epimerase
LWKPDPHGPGRLSRSFSQPIGRNLAPGVLNGYYLDLSIKARDPGWPPAIYTQGGRRLWVGVVQWGLGCHERYVSGEGDEWLAAAIAGGDALIAEQETDGPLAGGWVHRDPLPHTYPLDPPWLSGIVQGEAASLLVRLGRRTGDDRYMAAARAALKPFDVPAAAGGVAGELDGGFFPEEYPTSPGSFVLNGAIYAIWGFHDVAVGLDDAGASLLFTSALETVESNLHRYDTGYWSRYDLYPHRVMNIASRAYHELHVDQLRVTAQLTGSVDLAGAADRFGRYLASPVGGARAFARKVAFRLLVPRKLKLENAAAST